MLFCYTAFDYLSQLNVFYAKIDDLIELLGINAHYTSISRGVVDTRDLVYFFSFIAIFILLTKTALESRKWLFVRRERWDGRCETDYIQLIHLF